MYENILTVVDGTTFISRSKRELYTLLLKYEHFSIYSCNTEFFKVLEDLLGTRKLGILHKILIRRSVPESFCITSFNNQQLVKIVVVDTVTM